MLGEPGQVVLITCGAAGAAAVVEAAVQAAGARAAIPAVLWHPAAEEAHTEPPPPMAAAICRCDLWIEYASRSSLDTEAYEAALRSGTSTSTWRPTVVYGPGEGGAETAFRTKVYSEPDEYVYIDDVANATKVLARTIVDLVE